MIHHPDRLDRLLCRVLSKQTVCRDSVRRPGLANGLFISVFFNYSIWWRNYNLL
ncbi:hypothetical protein [Phocaeicola sp.]|uniref:hypothetical protein n=1 Tax=Phocaeicola sp. TaxID=2773926 RepID=UPI003A8E00C3